MNILSLWGEPRGAATGLHSRWTERVEYREIEHDGEMKCIFDDYLWHALCRINNVFFLAVVVTLRLAAQP